MTTLLIASLIAPPALLPQRPAHGPFRDEMRSVVPWSVYNKDRAPSMTITGKGLKITLSSVPKGWPYEYQWTGARRKAQIDVSRFGRLVADVPEVSKGSYAHFEIGILDAKGREVKALRSASVTEPGQIDFDLSAQLLPAIYTMDIRLIVGGSNTGASATYRWVRALPQEPSR